MTPAEHQLIVLMLQQQRLAYIALVENLKQRGVTEEDLEWSFQTLDPQRKKREAENVEETYRTFGKALGVTVPEFPPDGL